MPLCFVNKAKKYFVDRFSDKGPQPEKLCVDPVESGFQKISFAGIFNIEKLEKLREVKIMVTPLEAFQHLTRRDTLNTNF